MRILVFDTETTGFMPGNICQLSYMIKDNEDIQARNYYFKVNHIDPGAQMVHGLSVEMLDKLSNNKRFNEFSAEIKSDFESADILISHNFEFDIKFLSTEFSRCRHRMGLDKGFCTMKYFTSICKLKGRNAGYKYPRLEELAKFFGIGEKEIVQSTREIFGVEDIGFHDARYDVVTTYLCCMEASKSGYLKEVI